MRDNQEQMKMRDEYRNERIEKAELINHQLTAIAEEMGSDWRVWDRMDDCINMRVACGLCNDDGKSVFVWSDNQFFEFSPNDYPTYTNEEGREQRVFCRDLYNPKATEPRTKAKRDRAPKAIASQIKRKVLEPWQPIRARLQEVADSRNEYNNSKKSLCQKIAKYCGTEYKEGRTTYYGPDSCRIEVNSATSVSIHHLDADKALEALSALE
jgi:hypothetical protein